MRRQIVITFAAVMMAAPASGSSPEAVTAYEKEVAGACFRASGFKDARAHTKLIPFDDAVGVDALIVEGEYPQEHMKGQHGEMLCLFNKASRTAVTSELQHGE
jgi:hypothetical protein